jgi:uncharacterized delta-60 repeat protein
MNPLVTLNRKTIAFLILLSFGLYLCGLRGVVVKAQGQVQVTAADPPSAEQGTINLNVKVTGKGFKSGAKAKWFVTGTTDPGGVTVNSTTFVSSSEVTANITVADTAVISNFDIQVLNSDGRGGKGTELFAVTAKGGGQASCPPMQPAPTSDTKCYAASPGCLDVSFGGSGFVHTDPDGPSYGSGSEAVVVQPDGKIVVAGQSRDPSKGAASFTVFRYNLDGSLDTSFGDPDPTNPPLRRGYVVTSFTTGSNYAHAMLLQPDGKMVIGGSGSGMSVARYNSDGTLDTGFGSGGKVMVDFGSSAVVQQLALQSDGKLVLAGQAGSPSGFGIARLNTNGSLDSSFGTGGKLIANPSTAKRGSGFGWALAIQRIPATTGEERILVGGYSSSGSSAPTEWTLMRFRSNGATDTTFGTSGRVTTAFLGFGDQIRRLAIDSSNRIIAAGLTRTATDSCGGYVVDFAVVRYTQDGALDGTFAGGKQTVDVYGGMDQLYGMALQADGKIVLAGYAKSSDLTVSDIALVRFNVNGSRDASFGLLANGIVTTDLFGFDDYGIGVAVQPSDGKIVVTGSSKLVAGGYDEITVARYWP